MGNTKLIFRVRSTGELAADKGIIRSKNNKVFRLIHIITEVGSPIGEPRVAPLSDLEVIFEEESYRNN